jgi:lipid A oxidase
VSFYPSSTSAVPFRSFVTALLPVFGAFVFLHGGSAFAQSSQTAPSPPVKRLRQPIRLSFYTGTSTTLSSDIRIMQPAIGTDATYHNVGWRAKPFSGSIFYGIRLSYFLPNNPRLGFQLDLNHNKAYGQVQEDRLLTGTWLGEPVNGVETISDRMDRFNLTNGINTLTPGLLYRGMLMRSDEFPEGRVQPYVGGGPAFFIIVPLNNINRRTNDKDRTYSGVGIQLQAGVNYGLTRQFSLFAEAKYTQGMADVGTADGGKARTGIKSFLGVVGVTYGF